MKKSFLIVGALSAILSTNGYAESLQETVDSVSVARAARVSPKTKTGSTGIKLVAPRVQEKVGSGVVGITCPAGCTPDCAVISNIVLCECKDGNGNACTEEVVQTSATSGEANR